MRVRGEDANTTPNAKVIASRNTVPAITRRRRVAMCCRFERRIIVQISRSTESCGLEASRTANVAAMMTNQIEVSVVLVMLEGLNANVKKRKKRAKPAAR